MFHSWDEVLFYVIQFRNNDHLHGKVNFQYKRLFKKVITRLYNRKTIQLHCLMIFNFSRWVIFSPTPMCLKRAE